MVCGNLDFIGGHAKQRLAVDDEPRHQRNATPLSLWFLASVRLVGSVRQGPLPACVVRAVRDSSGVRPRVVCLRNESSGSTATTPAWRPLLA
jgi:hypothetical protein